MAGINKFCSKLIVCCGLFTLAVSARAIDFEFLYDDPLGQGFLDPVQGETRRDALTVAAEIWGRLIPPSYAGETVTIRIKYQDLGGGLANGAPHHFYSDFGSSNPAYQDDVNYPKALANHLAGRDLAPERHEAEINVDNMTNYYYGTDGMPGPGQFDFISVMAHEIGHGLGFYSTFQDDGEYGILGDRSHTEPICPGCLPTPYDRFLTLGGFGPTLISFPDDEARQPALTSNSVFWNGASAVAANGGMPPKIYAPSTFSDTSSISHTDDATFPKTIMISAIGAVEVTQTPTAVERGILRDIGWNISVTSATVNWIGLGANSNASTAANWSPRLPTPGDNLAFDQSPRTDVQMDLFLRTLGGISFPATAPAYTLRFKSNMDIALTGSGIINFSPSDQTIFLESSLQDDPTPALFHSAAALTFTGLAGMAGANAGNADYHLRGGGTSIGGGPPPSIPYFFDRFPGASITFERNSTAGTASFEIEGGAGDGGPNAQVTFRHNSTASAAEFRTKGGRLGPSLPLVSVAVGFGGQVLFEDSAKAGLATIQNEGQAEYFNGAGGFTIFTDDSTAENAEIHNHGATYTNGFGGATYFSDNSTAGAAHIFNHADGSNYGSLTGARTIFEDSSKAGTAIIENEGAPSQAARHGRTEFHGNSSAAGATINNRGYKNVGDMAGRTLFYDDSTAATATLRTFNGYSDHGRIEFHDRSTAADAHILIDDDPMVTASHGGYVIFFNDSTAAHSEITLRSGSAGFGGVTFYNNATAADAQIVTENNSGSIAFYGNSIAGDPPTADTPETANFSLGRGSGMSFYDQSTAADAIITVANGAFLHFNMSSSAGQSQIAAAGSSAYGIAGALITFNSTATVNGATIFAQGGTAPLAEGANVYFINGAHAGNATITLTGGTNGGGGARLTFNAAAKGDTARLIAHAGATVDFFDQRIYGDTSVGSIEGAGTFWLRGSLLTTGNRNTSTTVSGSIIDHPTGFVTGGRLTKVGTGTLTLAGANTYSGLTTAAGGRLLVNGSIAGNALVQNGATLGGTGTIGGTVTVDPGGILAPGTSPGTITVGGLAMMPGGILDLELGDPGDQIIITGNGNVALDGILDISLVDGFTPVLGQSFSVFGGAIGSLTGAFDEINSPIINGLTFNPMQSASTVMLEVVEATLVPGDYNGNGTVDAADYVLWRNNLGSPTSMLADDTPGVGPDDYTRWRVHFGQAPSEGFSAGSGPGATGSASDSGAIPESSTIVLFLITTLVAATRRAPAFVLVRRT